MWNNRSQWCGARANRNQQSKAVKAWGLLSSWNLCLIPSNYSRHQNPDFSGLFAFWLCTIRTPSDIKRQAAGAEEQADAKSQRNVTRGLSKLAQGFEEVA